MRLFVAFVFCALSVVLAVPKVAAESLNDVLARLDKSAESFESMTGNVTQLTHTDVIDENETQTAEVRLKRTKNGIVGRVDFGPPNKKTLGIRNRQVQMYYPKTNVVELYDVGKFGEQLDQFLLLGFGTSGKELQRNYKIKLIGTDNVNGKPAAHLELTPRSKEAQNIFKKADIWLGLDVNYPVKEKIQKNDQDYTLITYTDVKLNTPLSDKDLELNLPPDVKKIVPQQ